MKHRGLVAATLVGRAFALTAFTVALAMSSPSSAQQPAPKAQPKGAAPAPKAEPKGAAGAPAEPKIIFSPWTKVCPKGQEANAKSICLTGRDGTVESGLPVVAAVLIEPEGETRKTLRVTTPLGMSLPAGTRVVIDQGQPMTAPFVICAGNGCMSDYEASGELVANMKKGKGLAVQAVSGSGQVVTLVIPLADFAKAHDAPPTDPKVFEEQQRKRFEEFQKKQTQ
jgi:invasion protein IalB